MKVGDLIYVYEDPMTNLNLEGTAVVREILREGDLTFELLVTFPDEDAYRGSLEDGGVYRRTVLKPVEVKTEGFAALHDEKVEQ